MAIAEVALPYPKLKQTSKKTPRLQRKNRSDIITRTTRPWKEKNRWLQHISTRIPIKEWTSGKLTMNRRLTTFLTMPSSTVWREATPQDKVKRAQAISVEEGELYIQRKKKVCLFTCLLHGHSYDALWFMIVTWIFRWKWLCLWMSRSGFFALAILLVILVLPKHGDDWWRNSIGRGCTRMQRLWWVTYITQYTLHLSRYLQY